MLTRLLQSVKLEKTLLIFWEVSKQRILDVTFKKRIKKELDLHMCSFSCNFCFLYANVAISRATRADVCLLLCGSSGSSE